MSFSPKRPTIRRAKRRGASMVEYALLLVCVLIAAAQGIKAVGAKVAPAAEKASLFF
jgi:Flp pilus assembly pilin Flp